MWRRLGYMFPSEPNARAPETDPSRSSPRTLKESRNPNGNNDHAESRSSGIDIPPRQQSDLHQSYELSRSSTFSSRRRKEPEDKSYDARISGREIPLEGGTRRREKARDYEEIISHKMWMEGGGKEKEQEQDEETEGNDGIQLQGIESRHMISRAQTIKQKSAQVDEAIQSLIATSRHATEAAANHIQDLEQKNQGLEDQLCRMRGRAQKAEADATAAREAASAMQSLIATSRHAAEAAAKLIQDLKQENQGLEDQLRRMRERTQKAEAAAAATQQAASAAQEAASAAQQAASAAQNAASAAAAQRLVVNSASAATAFDVQRMGLTAHRASQMFRSKADSYAEDDIIRMVESLNAEALQCATFVAEAVMTMDINLKEEDIIVENCRKRAGDRVGQRLVEAMKHSADSGARDPFPLQLALQHTILMWSCHIVKSLAPENRDLNRHLTDILGRVSKNEEAAVAGKWRAIMAAQLKGPSTSYLAMFDDFQYMMVSAGWSTKATNSATLGANIQARLMALESNILKLKEAVIEGVTSMEMVPSMWVAGQPYHLAKMDSAFPDPTDPEFVNKPIVCTTGLGVQRLVVIRLKDGSLSRKIDNLLKPKVILPSVLDDDSTVDRIMMLISTRG
ncbi:hypothetical protein EST38_g174 [Candolleomyces aberdarensis]|uniref:Uncharacterized protein n=1 Tax=Candolleomyces aberdarensis TaxID=2316362 RepID=A0A4Q2E0U3_9AGAR|nr:hypothetical protein EST38_g174 [Candolleomyces aberdarensis]